MWTWASGEGGGGLYPLKGHFCVDIWKGPLYEWYMMMMFVAPYLGVSVKHLDEERQEIERCKLHVAEAERRVLQLEAMLEQRDHEIERIKQVINRLIL